MIIAFFGLGKMGLPMAKRLLKGGHHLRITVHRNKAPSEELEALGAYLAATPEEAVKEAEMVISILPGDREIEELFLDPAVREALKPGATVVEMSTASPGVAARLEAALKPLGVQVLDAPVSGGVKGAAEGTLTIIAGGEERALESARPVLDLMAARIFLVGAAGAGKAMKAVNQMMVACHGVVVSEALRLARGLGLDLDKVFDVVSSSSGASAIFSSKFKKMSEGDFSPNFTLAMMEKDLSIALAAGEGISLPTATLAGEIYGRVDRTRTGEDFSVVADHD